jgi:hypothetical protein
MADDSAFNELFNNPDLNDEKLQKHLNEYRAAIEEEFELKTKAAIQANDSDSVQELTQNFFKDNTAHAAAQIAWLAMNAESETVRLNASKFIIDKGLADSEKDGDPIKKLLSELTNKPAPTPEELKEK